MYLSRYDIESIADRVITAYKKLPVLRGQRVNRVHPDFLIHDLLGLSMDYGCQNDPIYSAGRYLLRRPRAGHWIRTGRCPPRSDHPEQYRKRLSSPFNTAFCRCSPSMFFAMCGIIIHPHLNRPSQVPHSAMPTAPEDGVYLGCCWMKSDKITSKLSFISKGRTYSTSVFTMHWSSLADTSSALRPSGSCSGRS